MKCYFLKLKVFFCGILLKIVSLVRFDLLLFGMFNDVCVGRNERVDNLYVV